METVWKTLGRHGRAPGSGFFHQGQMTEATRQTAAEMGIEPDTAAVQDSALLELFFAVLEAAVALPQGAKGELQVEAHAALEAMTDLSGTVTRIRPTTEQEKRGRDELLKVIGLLGRAAPKLLEESLSAGARKPRAGDAQTVSFVRRIGTKIGELFVHSDDQAGSLYEITAILTNVALTLTCWGERPDGIGYAMIGSCSEPMGGPSTPTGHDPSRAWSDRKDLRHLEAQLRLAPHALVRARQSGIAGSVNRDCLQPSPQLAPTHKSAGMNHARSSPSRGTKPVSAWIILHSVPVAARDGR